MQHAQRAPDPHRINVLHARQPRLSSPAELARLDAALVITATARTRRPHCAAHASSTAMHALELETRAHSALLDSTSTTGGASRHVRWAMRAQAFKPLTLGLLLCIS